jgi:hypothetical protein
MRNVALRMTVPALLLCLAVHAAACSQAVGYFHQVTRLKGKVVGKSLGPVQFRWLRRMYDVSGAELELYDYQGWSWKKDSKPLARTVSNSSGEFEFAALKEGHYTLGIKGNALEAWFDIEITNKVPVTNQITIDISPIAPDCTGGHEIEVQSAKK